MNLNRLTRIVTLLCRRPTTWHYTVVQQTRLLQQIRQISLSYSRYNEERESEGGGEEERNKRQKRINVDVETSIRYMNSEAFKKCYKDELIWTHYRRNHKGGLPPAKTRLTCVRGEYTATGNPCPICRDEYLLVDYRNTKLINHFTDPKTGELYATSRTGVCQTQQKKLEIEKFKAVEYGLLEGNVPFRTYQYVVYDKEFGIKKEKKKDTAYLTFAEWKLKKAYDQLKTGDKKTDQHVESNK